MLVDYNKVAKAVETVTRHFLSKKGLTFKAFYESGGNHTCTLEKKWELLGVTSCPTEISFIASTEGQKPVRFAILAQNADKKSELEQWFISMSANLLADGSGPTEAKIPDHLWLRAGVTEYVPQPKELVAA